MQERAGTICLNAAFVLGLHIELINRFFPQFNKRNTCACLLLLTARNIGRGRWKKAMDWDWEWPEKLIRDGESGDLNSSGRGGEGGGEMGRGSTVPLQPPALACQTHSCLAKWFFAVKFQGKDVTAEDLSQRTMPFFYCQKELACWGFPSSSPPPPPLLLSLPLSMQFVIRLCSQCF